MHVPGAGLPTILGPLIGDEGAAHRPLAADPDPASIRHGASCETLVTIAPMNVKTEQQMRLRVGGVRMAVEVGWRHRDAIACAARRQFTVCASWRPSG